MKLTILDIDLSGKKILVRVDFNVPMNENLEITDDTRIIESLPTIKKILSSGGRAILMSHLGRPKGKPNPKYSLKPVAEKLSVLLNQKIFFANDCIGDEAKYLSEHIKNGDCLLLENLRFYPDEEANNPDFASKLSGFGEIFVNDAFGTAHRAHASTEGITKFVSQSVAGYLMQKEINFLGAAIENPAKPFLAIMGGAKISGKIDVIENLLPKVDSLIIGGGMACTFFKAMGLEIGDSLLEEDKIELAKKIINSGKDKILLPVDAIIADKFSNDANFKIVPINEIEIGWRMLDVGPKSVEKFKSEILKSKTIVWNGPMGVFEMKNFSIGTEEVAKNLVEATKLGAITIVGGGDSAAAITQLGLEKSVSHVSTGGGASLEFLEGKILPGIEALTNKN